MEVLPPVGENEICSLNNYSLFFLFWVALHCHTRTCFLFFPQSATAKCAVSFWNWRRGWGEASVGVNSETRVVFYGSDWTAQDFYDCWGGEGFSEDLERVRNLLRFLNNKVSQGWIGFYGGSLLGNNDTSVEWCHKQMFILFSFLTLKAYLVSVVQFIENRNDIYFLY